jgi:CheY-like chemotaxis protein
MPRRRRILIVDDIPLMRTMLAKIVQVLAPKVFPNAGAPASVEIVEAADGRQALRALESSNVDLVFLDLMMPEMDGLSFLAAKRRDPTVTDIPVIVSSAVGDAGTLAQAEALGACAVIRKPFSVRAVEESLRAIASTL